MSTPSSRREIDTGSGCPTATALSFPPARCAGTYLRGLTRPAPYRRSRPLMTAATPDAFGSRADLMVDGERAVIFRLGELERKGVGSLDRLPFSIRVLLENALRHAGRGPVAGEHVEALARWSPAPASGGEIPFMPARVVLQDFTGVPCVVDLAAMRDAMARMGGDAGR